MMLLCLCLSNIWGQGHYVCTHGNGILWQVCCALLVLTEVVLLCLMSLEYMVWCDDACRGLNAPETVGQYAVIFIYKDGKHNLASSVVSKTCNFINLIYCFDVWIFSILDFISHTSVEDSAIDCHPESMDYDGNEFCLIFRQRTIAAHIFRDLISVCIASILSLRF